MGMSRHPFTLRKRFSASSRPAAIQRTTILPFFHRLTLPVTSLAYGTGSIARSASKRRPPEPTRAPSGEADSMLEDITISTPLWRAAPCRASITACRGKLQTRDWLTRRRFWSERPGAINQGAVDRERNEPVGHHIIRMQAQQDVGKNVDVDHCPAAGLVKAAQELAAAPAVERHCLHALA